VLVLIHAVADEQDMRKMGGLKIFTSFLIVSWLLVHCINGVLILVGFIQRHYFRSSL
jgi:hypothetical protein